jgi:hypothetical protein
MSNANKPCGTANCHSKGFNTEALEARIPMVTSLDPSPLVKDLASRNRKKHIPDLSTGKPPLYVTRAWHAAVRVQEPGLGTGCAAPLCTQRKAAALLAPLLRAPTPSSGLPSHVEGSGKL